MQDLTILYVEDEARSRRVMQILLEGRMGAKAIIFEDSEDFQAKAAAVEPKPQIVFLDIHVQPYNGFEMLQMLRRLPAYANTPIIALTASVMNEEVQQLQSAGFDGCLGKPVNADTFPQTIQAILAGESVWQILS